MTNRAVATIIITDKLYLRETLQKHCPFSLLKKGEVCRGTSPWSPISITLITIFKIGNVEVGDAEILG